MLKQNSTLLIVVLVIIAAFFVISSKQPSLLGFAAKTNMQEASYQKQVQDYTPIASSGYDNTIFVANYKESKYEDNPAGSEFSPPQRAPVSKDQYLNAESLQKQQLVSALGNRGTPNCREIPSVFRKYLTGC